MHRLCRKTKLQSSKRMPFSGALQARESYFVKKKYDAYDGLFLFLFSGLLKEWRSELQPWAMAVRLPNERTCVTPFNWHPDLARSTSQILLPSCARRSPSFNRKLRRRRPPLRAQGERNVCTSVGWGPLPSRAPSLVTSPSHFPFHFIVSPTSIYVLSLLLSYDR